MRVVRGPLRWAGRRLNARYYAVPDMDPNRDPRDETESRPQVSFTLRPDDGSSRDVFKELTKLTVPYHDLMIFDRTDSGTPGVVRFAWDTDPSIVDQAAAWFESLPAVASVRRSYGGPAGTA